MKSPKKILLTAYIAGKRTLDDYSHPSSPRLYTQSQLFACLVLKTFLGMDYRAISVFLSDFSEAREMIGLKRVPHYTTLQKACQRLLKQGVAVKLLDTTVRMHQKKSDT